VRGIAAASALVVAGVAASAAPRPPISVHDSKPIVALAVVQAGVQPPRIGDLVPGLDSVRELGPMTVADGSLWVVHQRWRKGFQLHAEVLRVDLARRQVTAPPILVGHEADWIIAAGGWIWVANVSDGTVSKIDPRRERVVATLQIPIKGRYQLGAIAFAAGMLWVVDNNAYHWRRGGLLWRMDPTTGAVIGPPVNLGVNVCGSFNVTVGLGSLWVAADAEERLLRIDPTTGAVEQRIRVPAAPMRPVIMGGSVWFVNEVEPLGIYRYDVATRRTHPVPQAESGNVYDLVRSGNALWMALSGDGGSSLAPLRPRSRQPILLTGDPTEVLARPNGFWAIEWDQAGLAASLVWLGVRPA